MGKKDKKAKGELGDVQAASDFQVPASNIEAKLDASEWPLLLKVSISQFT